MFDATDSVGAFAFQLPVFPEDLAIPNEPDPRRLPVVVRRPMLMEIAKSVAAEYMIPLHELLGESRAPVFSHPRQDFCWRARQLRNADGGRRYSLPQIGLFFAAHRPSAKAMDHTTVLHGIRCQEGRHRERLMAHIREMNRRSALQHGAG